MWRVASAVLWFRVQNCIHLYVYPQVPVHEFFTVTHFWLLWGQLLWMCFVRQTLDDVVIGVCVSVRLCVHVATCQNLTLSKFMIETKLFKAPITMFIMCFVNAQSSGCQRSMHCQMKCVVFILPLCRLRTNKFRFYFLCESVFTIWYKFHAENKMQQSDEYKIRMSGMFASYFYSIIYSFCILFGRFCLVFWNNGVPLIFVFRSYRLRLVYSLSFVFVALYILANDRCGKYRWQKIENKTQKIC